MHLYVCMYVEPACRGPRAHHLAQDFADLELNMVDYLPYIRRHIFYMYGAIFSAYGILRMMPYFLPFDFVKI